ncbi:MAG: DUF2953 domain-containing protein [Firmicutes bacterium]|nr:DUF2953 domain-containing protein [Candidatus Fermentithermobacillaceae bacterium]
MEYVLFILTILGKLMAVLVLFVLGVLLFALTAPIRLKFSGAGSVRGWAALLEDGAEEAGPGVRGEGSFQGQVSFLGGLVEASVVGRWGREKAPAVPGTGIETRFRFLRTFTVDAGKLRAKRPARRTGTADSGRTARVKQVERGRKRGRVSESPSGRRPGGFSQILESIGKDEFRAELIRAIKALYRAFHLEVRGEADFGLGDPGATGMVYGIAQGVMGSLGITALTLTPNFEEDVLRVKAYVEARFLPGAVLFVLVRTMLSRPVRPLWWKRKKIAPSAASRLIPTVKGHSSL